MKLFLFSLSFLFTCTINAQEQYMLVGTYDSPKSEGVYVFKFNTNDGSAKEISHLSISNPSYLAISRNKRYVYAVNEKADSFGKGGMVTAMRFNKRDGSLTLLNQQLSEGNNPCHISIDKTGKWVIVANYATGNFSLLPVNKNGSLGPAKKVIQHVGSGPDKVRQSSPHAHQAFLKKNNTDLYVNDLGIDKIMTYRFNAKAGTIIPSKLQFVSVQSGSGPRHLDIHPNGKYVYLVGELTGSVFVFHDFGNGDLHEIQSLSTLPLSYKGPAGSADIHVSPDGNFLYVSNRGMSNTIAIFSIDKNTGLLTLVGHQETLGESPRNFNFDPTGKFLLVANQKTDEIVVFKRDIETGLLTDTGNRISIGKPVCIKWIQ